MRRFIGKISDILCEDGPRIIIICIAAERGQFLVVTALIVGLAFAESSRRDRQPRSARRASSESRIFPIDHSLGNKYSLEKRPRRNRVLQRDQIVAEPVTPDRITGTFM